MTLRARTALLLAALLALLAVGLASELVARLSPARLEVARARPTQLWPATRARLQRLDGDVLLTYFASAPADTPSGLRGVRGEVERLLGSLAAASNGRLRWEIAEPDSDIDQAAFAALARAKPVSVRSVTRDAWSEERVWSTLSIAYGARPRAAIAPITPQTLGVLQGWICAQLDQLENPARPRVAVIAPARDYTRLVERLERSAEVLTLERGAPLPARPPADLVWWLDPQAPDDADARTLLAWSEAGSSVVVAASAWSPGPLSTPDRPQFVDSGALPADFLRELGLARLEGPLFDVLSEARVSGTQLPWRVRAIAPNQDFRAFEGQPNGTLVFGAPSALIPDVARLDELGYDPLSLVNAGPGAWWLRPPAGPLDPERMGPEHGSPAPKASLAMYLAPRNARRGGIVVLGASNLLGDLEFAREDSAHLTLFDVLLANLASGERLVAARLQAPGAEALPQLDARSRVLWRGLCVLAFPLLMGLLALLRARAAGGLGSSLRPLRGALAILAGLLLAALLLALVDRGLRGRADLTRQGLHTLDEHTHALARGLADPLRAELYLSDNLPPASAQLPGRLRDVLRELERSLPGGLQFETHRADELDAAARAELAARGIAPHAARVQGADEHGVVQVWSALALSAGGREQVLDFGADQPLADLELRLALALGRLAGDPRARGHVLVACDTPRLSPAEAHLDYQLKGLFAPTGADIYADARATLERVGLRVSTTDPARPTLSDEVDALVWLQPRRSTDAMLAVLVQHLRRGGHALVAAQHYNVRARQLEGSGFRTVYWPEPQFPDLEQGWLAELGVLLQRELLCDESSLALALPTEVQRPGAGRDFVLQESLLPFQLRVLAANAPDSELARGLGDQLFLWGNRIVLDRERLARFALTPQVLLASSTRSWSIDWQGGYLTAEMLAPPADATRLLGSQPLAVRLRGSFPALPAEQGAALLPDSGAPAGELVLVGASEPFKNAHLARAGLRGDQLLVDLVCDLALGPDYARIAARRARVQGFEAPPPERKLLLRALTIGLWPVLLALAGLLWGLARRRVRA